MSNEKLKPCPAASKYNCKLTDLAHDRDHRCGSFAVECQNCGWRGPYEESRDKADESWNTRAEPEPTYMQSTNEMVRQRRHGQEAIELLRKMGKDHQLTCAVEHEGFCTCISKRARALLAKVGHDGTR